jgi:hypothetical protein
LELSDISLTFILLLTFKLKTMKQFIKTTLVNLYRECTTDSFGQVEKFNFTPKVFGELAEDVQQYCKEHKGILSFSTYGWRYGTYTAFTIIDEDIKKSCREALRTNPNYIRNMTNW